MIYIQLCVGKVQNMLHLFEKEGNQMNQLEKAQQLATKAHENQTRKNSSEPYIEHPKRVAMLLKEAGFPEEVVIAGYLHDVVEDTPITIEDIRDQFGEEVAEIVAYHTEDKTLSWEERKQHTINAFKTAPYHVQALIIADKLDNLQSVVEQYNQMGDKVWDAFKRGKEQQAWYNCSIAKEIPQLENPPLYFERYKQLVEQFFLYF